jgi:xanthine dehydrogenase YagR molybdenum-binding subunit
MDELAIKLKMDPVELRLSLDTLIDEEKNKPFSSRHLKECLQVGAERFGWSRRTPEVGSMRKGDLILGWGVAAASWGANRGVCEASTNLRSDGTARVSCGTQDIGTGTYTVIAQVIADKTGIPVNKVEVVLGSSSLPPGPTSGGSTATSTLLPAVIDAVNAAVKVVLSVASSTKGSPFQGMETGSLTMTEGRVHAKGQPASSGVPFDQILRMANLASANGDGKSGGLGADPKSHDYSTHSFGVQFVEVEWDPGIARLRVSRVVSVVDGGRIINKRTATNQMEGAIIMGVGMGLFEETIYDPRNGHAVNDNFADYIVPTIADMPQIDVHFLDIPDLLLNEYGARGIGEIGLAGVAPAITAAVYHASGLRIRKLPVRIEDLLEARVAV